MCFLNYSSYYISFFFFRFFLKVNFTHITQKYKRNPVRVSLYFYAHIYIQLEKESFIIRESKGKGKRCRSEMVILHLNLHASQTHPLIIKNHENEASGKEANFQIKVNQIFVELCSLFLCFFKIGIGLYNKSPC